MGSVIGEGQTEASNVSPIPSPSWGGGEPSDILQSSQVGRGPKQAVQLGVQVGKTSRFRQSFIVKAGPMIRPLKQIPAKQNACCLILSLSEGGCRKGLQDRVLIPPHPSLHLKDPVSVAGAGGKSTAAGGPEPLPPSVTFCCTELTLSVQGLIRSLQPSQRKMIAIPIFK